MKMEHAEALVSKGQIRIGTLYDFRKEEIYGNEVGDKSEGSARVNGFQAQLPKRFDPIKFMGKQPLLTMYAGGHLTRDKRHKVHSFTTHDVYVFCAAWELNTNMDPAFGRSVVVIRNVQSFVSAIARALPASILKWDIGRCIYSDKENVAKLKNLPSLPFWKPERYAYQDEWRAWFMSSEDHIKPEIIESFEIAKHCSLL